jgi:type II secretory ATPase GspE/PulE/Tfp pilus assembly ATPase PilB-like protein
VKKHVAATHGFIDNVEAMQLCGQETMRETGLDLIRAGVTSIDEVARFVPISNLMGQLL